MEKIIGLFHRIKLTKFGLALLLVIVGFGLFSRYLFCSQWFNSIEFSKEISPLDIFDICITALIAIWLGRYVTKKLSEQRFIKEFIISDAYKIEENILVFEQQLQSSKADVSVIFDILHRLCKKIDILEKTLNWSKMNSSRIENIKHLHSQLYLTTTNANGTTTDLISHKMEIMNICNNMIENLREIICHINRI